MNKLDALEALKRKELYRDVVRSQRGSTRFLPGHLRAVDSLHMRLCVPEAAAEGPASHIRIHISLAALGLCAPPRCLKRNLTSMQDSF